MSKYSRIEVVQTMHATGIVPVFYHSDAAVCKKILACCYSAGILVFEFTNRGDFDHEVFAELHVYVSNHLKDMILGVGSVMDPGTAALYMQLGANFIISPILNPEIAKVCNRRKVTWIPGSGTVTEISNAEALGAEVVKIFPSTEVGGPNFVKSVKGPMPWSSIMATGGIRANLEDLKEWFDSGVHCVGLGSQVFFKKMDGSFDYLLIERKLKEVVSFVAVNYPSKS